jgi:hypothetical protein
MLYVNDVEARNGRVESNIGLGDRPAVVVRSIFDLRKMFLDPIKRFEELHNGCIVRLLRGSKARAIHTIVDIVIGPLVRLLDLLPQDVWEEIYALVLLGEKVIELSYYQPRFSLGIKTRKNHTS